MKFRVLFKMQKCTFSLNILQDIDEEILLRFEKFGMDKLKVRDYLQRNIHNSTTTTYYLWLKKKLINGGTIVTAAMMQQQQAKQLMLSQKQPLRLLLPQTSNPTSNAFINKDTNRIIVANPRPVNMPTSFTMSPKNKEIVRPSVEQRVQKTSLGKYKIDKRCFESPSLPKIAESRTEDDEQEQPDVLLRTKFASPVKKLLLIPVRHPAKSLMDRAEEETSVPSQIKLDRLIEADPDVARMNRLRKDASGKHSYDNKKSTAAQSNSLANSKKSRLQGDLKKLTSVVKAGIAGKAKAETRSTSNSRDRVSKMKSFDVLLEKNSARKTSNPSFQSSSTEEQPLTKSFAGLMQAKEDAKRIRNPFALDLISDMTPRQIHLAILEAGKRHNIATTVKVTRHNQRDPIRSN
jgi:hypothetical protein